MNERIQAFCGLDADSGVGVASVGGRGSNRRVEAMAEISVPGAPGWGTVYGPPLNGVVVEEGVLRKFGLWRRTRCPQVGAEGGDQMPSHEGFVLPAVAGCRPPA